MIRKTLGAVTTLTLIIGLSVIPAVPAQAAACVNIPAVAHRGGTERYVENTRNAFRDAANRGVLSWETDVRFTADNVPVLLHDETLDRTTDGTGPVADLTRAELAGVRTADGQAVSLLAELVNDAEVDKAKLFVELKTVPTPEQWESLDNALRFRAGVLARTVLMSFDGPTVLEARIRFPGVATGLVQSLGAADPATITSYGANYIKHQDSITGARLDAWSGPLSVFAWTVDNTDGWERMHWYTTEPGKLDGVITNKPGAYRTWQAARVC